MNTHENTPGAYLLRAKELIPRRLPLYTATFALALFCGALRSGIAYPLLWIAFRLLGAPAAPANDIALLIGYGPLVSSLATLILPFGGWWWKQRGRGRTPSAHERALLADAFATLRAADPTLRPPRSWFVLDTNQLRAAVYADTLMLTRGLLESGYLEGVLAHELGHLNSSDARLAAALHRLTLSPRRRAPRGLRAISMITTGACVLRVTRGPWGKYWREREHQADRYAAQLGQAASLARFLETNTLDGDLPVPTV
jgi:Zn-dependent protease with chaperone function